MYTLCDLILHFRTFTNKLTRSYQLLPCPFDPNWGTDSLVKLKGFFGGEGGKSNHSTPNWHIVHRVGQSVGHMLVAHVGGTRWPVFWLMCWVWSSWYVGCEFADVLAIYWWYIGKHVGPHVGWCFGGVRFVTLSGCETFQNHVCRKQQVINFIFWTLLVLA